MLELDELIKNYAGDDLELKLEEWGQLSETIRDLAYRIYDLEDENKRIYEKLEAQQREIFSVSVRTSD